MKFQFYVFSLSTEELPLYRRESNMQGCLEFPILVYLTTYLTALMKKVSCSVPDSPTGEEDANIPLTI